MVLKAHEGVNRGKGLIKEKLPILKKTQQVSLIFGFKKRKDFREGEGGGFFLCSS